MLRARRARAPPRVAAGTPHARAACSAVSVGGSGAAGSSGAAAAARAAAATRPSRRRLPAVDAGAHRERSRHSNATNVAQRLFVEPRRAARRQGARRSRHVATRLRELEQRGESPAASSSLPDSVQLGRRERRHLRASSRGHAPRPRRPCSAAIASAAAPRLAYSSARSRSSRAAAASRRSSTPSTRRSFSSVVVSRRCSFSPSS